MSDLGHTIGDARKRQKVDQAFDEFGNSGAGIGNAESDRIAFQAGYEAGQSAGGYCCEICRRKERE